MAAERCPKAHLCARLCHESAACLQDHHYLSPGTRNATGPLFRRESSDLSNSDGDRIHAERLEQVLGLAVDLDGRIGARVQGGDIGNVSAALAPCLAATL